MDSSNATQHELTTVRQQLIAALAEVTGHESEINHTIVEWALGAAAGESREHWRDGSLLEEARTFLRVLHSDLSNLDSNLAKTTEEQLAPGFTKSNEPSDLDINIANNAWKPGSFPNTLHTSLRINDTAFFVLALEMYEDPTFGEWIPVSPDYRNDYDHIYANTIFDGAPRLIEIEQKPHFIVIFPTTE